MYTLVIQFQCFLFILLIIADINFLVQDVGLDALKLFSY